VTTYTTALPSEIKLYPDNDNTATMTNWRQNGWGVKLTTIFHLTSKLRMTGALHPLRHTPLCSTNTWENGFDSCKKKKKKKEGEEEEEKKKKRKKKRKRRIKRQIPPEF
jgi:hypothetical protein